MRTLGIDLAAAAKKTAAAVLEWTPGSARLEHLALDVGDQEIVDLFGNSWIHVPSGQLADLLA